MLRLKLAKKCHAGSPANYVPDSSVAMLHLRYLAVHQAGRLVGVATLGGNTAPPSL